MKPPPSKDSLLREFERLSQDLVQVLNPLKEDYVLEYNGWEHVFPAGNPTQKEFYLVKKFLKEYADLKFNQLNEKRLIEAKKKYTGDDWGKEGSRVSVFSNDPEMRTKFLDECQVRLVSRYGRKKDESESEEALGRIKELGTLTFEERYLLDTIYTQKEIPVTEAAKPKDAFAEAISED